MEVQLASPPSELVEEIAPLAMEEASPVMLETQSLTLIIQNLLSELAPKGEAVEVPGSIEEEEGSSSTLEKAEMEDRRSTSAVQVTNVAVNQTEILSTDMPLEWVETLHDEPRGQSPIVIEESMPERSGKGLEAPRLEEEVQIVPPPTSKSRSCFYKNFP